MRPFRRAFLAVAIIIPLQFSSVSANAAESVGSTKTIADEVSAVDEAVASARQDPAQIPADELKVTLPTDQDRAISVREPSGGTAVKLNLPQGKNAGPFKRNGNKAVSQVPEQGYSVVAEPVADGARGLVVVQSPTAPTQYEFSLDLPAHVRPVLDDGGAISLIATAEGINTKIGELSQPWALDADGHVIATRYEIHGSTVTQVVDHAHPNVKYPVVADPKLTFGRGVYLNLWGWEANAVGNALGILVGSGGFIGCNFSKLPSGIPGLVVKIICNAGASQNAVAILRSIGTKNYNPYTCYQNIILPTTGGWRAVDAKNCR